MAKLELMYVARLADRRVGEYDTLNDARGAVVAAYSALEFARPIGNARLYPSAVADRWVVMANASVEEDFDIGTITIT